MRLFPEREEDAKVEERSFDLQAAQVCVDTFDCNIPYPRFRRAVSLSISRKDSKVFCPKFFYGSHEFCLGFEHCECWSWSL